MLLRFTVHTQTQLMWRSRHNCTEEDRAASTFLLAVTRTHGVKSSGEIILNQHITYGNYWLEYMRNICSAPSQTCKHRYAVVCKVIFHAQTYMYTI